MLYQYVRSILAAVCLALALSAPQTVAAREKIPITQYGQWLAGLPWLVALKQGFLKEEGLEVEGFISSQGGGTSVRNVLANPLPFGEVASSAAVSAIKEGLPLVILYSVINHPGEITWITLPGKPISSIHDLVGKTVGYTSAKSTTEMMLRMSLEAAGVPADKIKMVPTGGLGGGLSALSAGGVDAAPIADPALSKSLDQYKLVFRVADVMGALDAAFGVTTPEFAKSNPEKLRKLVSARRKAVDWIYANPEAAVAYCAEFLEIDKELAGKVLPKFISWRFWSPGSFNAVGLENNLKGLRLVGSLDGTVDWAKHIDQRFLPDDLRTKF